MGTASIITLPESSRADLGNFSQDRVAMMANNANRNKPILFNIIPPYSIDSSCCWLEITR